MNKPPESHKCRACRRPLSSAVSIRYGYGPDCLRRAVAAGTLCIEALAELSSEQRETKQNRAKRTKCAEQLNHTDTKTLDLFDQLRSAALDDLRLDVAACASVGVTVSYQISD